MGTGMPDALSGQASEPHAHRLESSHLIILTPRLNSRNAAASFLPSPSVIAWGPASLSIFRNPEIV